MVSLGALEKNLQKIDDVQKRAGCTVLLALKGFAMWSTFPLVRKYLAGIAASGAYEAQLGREKFGGQVHTYSPAFDERELRAVASISEHVVFNSLTQWTRFRPVMEQDFANVKVGIRVNPEHREVEVELYDPCAPKSRLGVTRAALDRQLAAGASLSGISGLHFHTLCELNADALARTLPAVEEKFGDLLQKVDWVNFGGGHHITRDDYDTDLLVELVVGFRERHNVDVFLEPGEAIALNTGVLVAEVIDIIVNDIDIAILNVSATAHMPDVLEMPYRPQIVGGYAPGERPHTYRLGGPTCLAGDVIGDWSFDEPLVPGSKLVFLDMAHYSMVKTTMFNGVHHPDIAVHDPKSGNIEVVRRFSYADFRDRLS